MTRSSGLRSSCCKAGRPRDAPLSAPAQGKLPLPPGPVLQAFLAAGGSDVTICVPRTPFQSGGPSRIEPRWPPGAEPPCVWRGETSRTPRGGLETSSQAFQDTCVLFFFFLFIIIVTLANPSMNRQIRLQRDGVQTGRERRRLCICSAAPAGQTARLPAGTGKNRFRGARGRRRRVSLRGWRSRAWVEVGERGGVWSCPGGLACLSRCRLWDRDSRPAASSAQEGDQALWEEKALQANKAKTSRVIAEPTLAHVWWGGW